MSTQTKSGNSVLRIALPALAAAVLLPLSGCDGSSAKTPGGSLGGDASLVRMEFGRLVDVYSYRLVDTGGSSESRDRRNTVNRQPVLVERNVVVSPSIESQALFDSVGQERVEADYRFLPFDVSVGHEELMVLWDDRFETGRFTAAVDRARLGLVEVPASYRDQNTNVRPIPVIPRNAALKLTFNQSLGLDDAFFAANPSAVQLLEFRADPNTAPPIQAFRPVPYRIIAKGEVVIVDTTIIGNESQNGQSSTGLPSSPDSVSANLRLAIPVDGVVGRQLEINPDAVAELNGVDSRGNNAVIRDFRSGNASDGAVGALVDVEAPMIVTDRDMGIIDIDTTNRIVTINKRFARVAIRGRVPFVDGGQASSGLPAGPSQVPTQQPLRTGDLLFQDVESPSGQTVRIRSEVLQNLDVGSELGDPAFPALGLAADGTDGGDATLVRLRLSTITAVDDLGQVVTMQASGLPLGQDCVVRVHYYNGVRANPNLRGALGSPVSDAGRAVEFLSFDPAPPFLDGDRNPVPRGSNIDPNASIALRFSEPMDLETIQPLDNYAISNETFDVDSFPTLITEAKPASLSLVPTRRVDLERDGTFVRLQSPVGLFHAVGDAEDYWFHMLVGDGSPADLAGNGVDLFDRDGEVTNFSIQFSLDDEVEDNLVGWHNYRFAEADEDGTPPGSIDFFGQFSIGNGSLAAAPTTRFSKTADLNNLVAITRFDRGECYYEGDEDLMLPPGTIPPGASQPPGVLYWTPSMVSTQPGALVPAIFTPPAGPRVFGGIVEPHNPRGSRLQMTYREDDFDLGYVEAGNMLIDLEQLAFGSWNNQTVRFDEFDRYTLEVAHSGRRPDLLFGLVSTGPETPPVCNLDCASLFSGLSTTFGENLLEGTETVTLLEGVVYKVQPNDAFKTDSGTTFVPYPKFERSYTWRDSRHVSWSMAENRAVGLGGARQPDGTFPARDRTAHVSSPWVDDVFPDENYDQLEYILDEGDFRGDRTLDLDPIALPLLLDFKVFADDPSNGVASGLNLFHLALVGPTSRGPAPPPALNGYYNSVGATGQNGAAVCGGNDWPSFRVHTSGGVDGLGQEVFVDPATTDVAVGGWIKDVGLGDPIEGRFQVKAGDGTLYWAHADFVRKVSMVTFGFFDTRKPNEHLLDTDNFETTWPGLADQDGFPDFDALGAGRSIAYGISDVAPIMDPPLSEQPAGTTVLLEFRGVESIERATVYDKVEDDTLEERGNLLNPNYASDAFRSAMPNAGSEKDTPRVRVNGMTPYVDEDGLDSIRSGVTGQLPRYMNVRLIFENNTNVTPALSASLRSLAITYRMTAPN